MDNEWEGIRRVAINLFSFPGGRTGELLVAAGRRRGAHLLAGAGLEGRMHSVATRVGDVLGRHHRRRRVETIESAARRLRAAVAADRLRSHRVVIEGAGRRQHEVTTARHHTSIRSLPLHHAVRHGMHIIETNAANHVFNLRSGRYNSSLVRTTSNRDRNSGRAGILR